MAPRRLKRQPTSAFCGKPPTSAFPLRTQARRGTPARAFSNTVSDGFRLRAALRLRGCSRRAEGSGQTLLKRKRWIPTERVAHALVRVAQRLQPGFEPAGNKDLRELVVPPKHGFECRLDQPVHQRIGHRDAEAAFARPFQIIAKKAPDPFALAVDDVEGLPHGSAALCHGERRKSRRNSRRGSWGFGLWAR